MFNVTSRNDCYAARGLPYSRAMCAHYESLSNADQYAKHFQIARPATFAEPPLHIFLTALAPMIRRPLQASSGDDAVPARELVTGHFGLLPSFAKDIKYGLRT